MSLHILYTMLLLLTALIALRGTIQQSVFEAIIYGFKNVASYKEMKDQPTQEPGRSNLWRPGSGTHARQL